MSESLKKCIKCEKEIPQKAAKCEFCKASQVKPKDYLIGCGALLVLCLIIGSCNAIFGIGKLEKVDLKAPKEKQVQQAQKLYDPAFEMAKEFVKDKLKSPASAKFQSRAKNSVIWWKENEFACTVKVDSQNGFGAMIRTNFIVRVRYNGDDKWSLLEISTL